MDEAAEVQSIKTRVVKLLGASERGTRTIDIGGMIWVNHRKDGSPGKP